MRVDPTPLTNHTDPRVRAVAAAVYFMNEGDMGKAKAEFNSRCRDVHVKNIGKYIERWQSNVVENGMLLDSAHPGRPRTLPLDVAEHCSALFKAGYKQPSTTGKGTVQKYFTSIHEAVTRVPQLREILDTYHITEDTLLDSMRRVDPDLTHKTQYTKAAFTEQEMEARQLLASFLNMMTLSIPNWYEWVIWMDCGSIILAGSTEEARVWCDKHDLRVTLVIPEARFKKRRPIVLRFLIAINARLGPFHIEFTTGTTDLERSPEFKAMHGDKPPYKVST